MLQAARQAVSAVVLNPGRAPKREFSVVRRGLWLSMDV